MDEQLVFKSDKAAYTARAGDDLLGGGQTAVVYRVRAGDGQVYALKWLTDAVYEQRFFQEVDWLNEFYYAPDEYGLKRDSQSLTPRVYDEQRQGERRFFVMDLAPGQPLDEVLRRRGRLPELPALTIAAQLARVFTALHELLDRSYLDFQPRNVFWQEESGQVMVIDWNLLSAKGKPDVRADLRSIGTLLHRMALGGLPPTGEANARGRVAAYERWQEISLGARVLLQDLLEPRPDQRAENARTARERLDALCQRWEKPSDDLVREAAALFKQIRNGDALATAQNALLLDVAVCLDLASRQTGALVLSSSMALVRRNLEQEVAGRREELTALARAISFFRSGDLETAALLFEQALVEATRPEDELQVRRWQAVLEARHQHSADFDGPGRQRAEALLETFQSATQAYLDRSLSSPPDLAAWRRVNAEAATQANNLPAVKPLAVEASAWPVILALQAEDWSEVPGETHRQRLESAADAKTAIGNLSYDRCLWQVLGIGDPEASMTAVGQAISTLQKAVDVEKKWQALTDHAKLGRWKKVDESVIRKLFEESDKLPVSAEPVFNLLNVAIDRCGDAGDETTEALLEGLTTSTGLAEDDRRRAQAYEHWLQRMKRLERFVSVWGTHVSVESTGQDLTAEATPSTASEASVVENSTTLSFPASWALSELRELSQKSFVKNLRERLLATAAQAVRTCVREVTGLSQAELMIGYFAREKWIDQSSREWRSLQDELKSARGDQKLERTRQDIELATNKLVLLEEKIAQKEEILNNLVSEIGSREEKKTEIDRQLKEYDINQRQAIDQDLAQERTARLALVNQDVTQARAEIGKLRMDREKMRRELSKELDSLEDQKNQLEKEIANLHESIRQLTPTTAVTNMQLKELEHLREKVKKLDEDLASLQKANSAHVFNVNRVTPNAPPTVVLPQESQWQRLYEASKDLDTRLLCKVKATLESLGKLRMEVEGLKDQKLIMAIQSLDQKWKPWYESNESKWNDALFFRTGANYEQAAKLYEELYGDRVEGNWSPGETIERLVDCWYQLVVKIMRTSMTQPTAEQKSWRLEQTAIYAAKCRMIMHGNNYDSVKEKVGEILKTHSTFQKAG